MRKKVFLRQSTSHCYFLTFTRKVTYNALRIQLNTLRADFRKLRQRRVWKDHVVGCAFAVHLVDDGQPDHWHPHLHLIASTIPPATGDFTKLPWRENWRAITGDSYVVDVQEVKNIGNEPGRLLNYVFRPVFEPFKDAPELVGEFVAATKSKPLTGTVGAWRGDFVTAEGGELDLT